MFGGGGHFEECEDWYRWFKVEDLRVKGPGSGV